MRKLKKLNGVKLIFLCGAVLCALWLCKNTFAFGYEAVSRAAGRMETFTLSADDFELIGIVKNENGGYVSTDGDPQLVLTRDMMVSRISIDGTFSVNPGEMLVYYTQQDGQPFSAAKRYWFYADSKAENRYTAAMPAKKLKSVRIDPTTFAGNTMTIDSITFNAPKSFWQFFKVTFRDVFNLVVYSCIAASMITLLRETFAQDDYKKLKR